MIALVDKCLLQILLKRLHIELINDLGKHSESISLTHLVLILAHIFSQLTDDDEDFILVCIQLLFHFLKTLAL